MVSILLQYGADPDLANDNGMKSIDFAEKEEIKTLLLQNIRERSFCQYIWYLMKDIVKSFLNLILNLTQ